MSQQQPTHFVQQWTDGITLLAQQKMTRLRRAVRVETGINGDRAFFDQLGSVTAQVKTTRHGDTPLTDTPASRRMVTLSPYEHADLIDDSDKVRTLNDPTNDYTRVFAAAFGRAQDQAIIDAAFATASTGTTGSTQTSFPAAFTIASGSGGMTLAKLTEGNKILRAAENDPEEGFFIAVSQEQVEDVLNDSTLTSQDYNAVRLLMRGDIQSFMGFEWINTERLGTASSERRVIAWAKNSLLIGVGKEPSGRISERDDKSYSTRVFYSMDIGATRMDETGVVEILCTE